jgi:flagellar biosynthesis protein FliR
VISADETIAGLQDALSLRHRVRSVVQLAGSAAVVTLVVVLALTEDDLPTRTQIGFGAVVGAGLLTMIQAVRALRRRGHLFARDRVIAGWIAAGFAVLLAAGLALAGRGLLGLPVALAAIGFLMFTQHKRKRLERQR